MDSKKQVWKISITPTFIQEKTLNIMSPNLYNFLGNYYIETPDYVGIPLIWRKITICTRENIDYSTIELLVKVKRNADNYVNINNNNIMTGPSYLTVFKKIITLIPTNPNATTRYFPVGPGNYFPFPVYLYEIDLWSDIVT
jgi:hypothetical protein